MLLQAVKRMANIRFAKPPKGNSKFIGKGQQNENF